MGKGGEKQEVKKGRKISLEELSAHRTPNDGMQLFHAIVVALD
jgi:hypothetical protein